MSDPQIKNEELGVFARQTFNPANWLWMVPLAILMSPLGAVFLMVIFDLGFYDCIFVVFIQMCAYMLAGIMSNWGE